MPAALTRFNLTDEEAEAAWAERMPADEQGDCG